MPQCSHGTRLQHLSGESMTHCTAITTDDACLDIAARGSWSAAQHAYFNIRVFHPNVQSNNSGSISTAYNKHGSIKKRAYCSVFEMLSKVSSLPSLFSTTGEMGEKASTFYKWLADIVFLEIEEIVLCCQKVVEVQALICCSHGHHVHPWNKIIQQQSIARSRHHPCSIRGWHHTRLTRLFYFFVCVLFYKKNNCR